MANRSTQYQNWFFTFNLPQESKINYDQSVIETILIAAGTTYAKFQLEQGEETHTRHYQGIFRTSRRTFESLRCQLQELLPGIHLEPLRSWAAGSQYVGKEATRLAGPWEVGSPPGRQSGPGKGGSGLRYPPRPDPWAPRNVQIYVGPPASGKTYAVRHYAREQKLDIYSVPDKAKQSTARWIGNYSGEPIVIIDEFKFSDFSRGTWLTLLDAYDTNVTASMGGKTVKWQPQHVYLITNHQGEVEKLLADPAIKRRIRGVGNFYAPHTDYSKNTEPERYAFYETEAVQPEGPTDEEIPDPPEEI